MTQFYDPNHRPVSPSAGRRKCSVRPRESGSRCRQSDRAAHTTDEDNVVDRSEAGAPWPNQPAVLSGAQCASAAVVTARPQSKAGRSASQLTDVERASGVSAAAAVTLTTRRRSTRFGSAAAPDAQPSRDADVKPVLDETAGQTGRPAIAETGCVEAFIEDVKPVVGLLAEKRRVGRRNRSRNRLPMDHGSSTAAGHCKRRRRKRHVDTLSVESDAAARNDVIGTRRRRRPGGHVVDSDEVEDVKPVVGTARRGRKERKAKRVRPSEDTGAKSAVEVVGEIAWTGFEEQDVKPDLSSLDVKRADGVTVKTPRRRPRKDFEDMKPAVDRVGRSRKRRRRKRSRRSKTSVKNTVEAAGEMAWMGFEEQDVKPDLSSLDLAVERKARRRSKRVWSRSPGVLTRSMHRVRQLLNAAAHPPRPADSPPRCAQSPPFTLLSPSKIKVEVES